MSTSELPCYGLTGGSLFDDLARGAPGTRRCRTGALEHLVVDPLHTEFADPDVGVEPCTLVEVGLLGQTEMTDDMSHRRP